VREGTEQEKLNGKAPAEFMRLSKLPKNLRKSDAEIWGAGYIVARWFSSFPCANTT
jgi:hypothetical protein